MTTEHTDTMDEITDLGEDHLIQPDVKTDPPAEVFEQAAKAAARDEAPVIDDNLWDEFDTPNPHVTLDNPIYKRQKLDPYKPALVALKAGAVEIHKLLESKDLLDLDDEKIAKLSKADRRLVHLSRTLSPIWQDQYFDDIDKTGDWRQHVVHNETKLGPSKLRAENMKDPVAAIRASFGQGATVQVPLWNTGLWIAFRAPTAQALLDLDQKVRLEKINLGRGSNGMVFSNTEVYTVETYVRFALEHVEAVNYQFKTGDTVDELLSVIRNRDYQQVLWGMISAMYPNGYQFRQPCVAENCDHVDEMILNFARLGITDNDKISAKQALMMASRRTKRDAEWLEEYQREFTFYERRVPLGDNLTAVLRVPSLAQQITAGHLWVDGIAKATTEAFGHKLAELDRVRHIVRSGALTNLRQFSHFVAHFEHHVDPDSEPRIIEETEDKDRILEVLSETPEVSEILNKAILDYIRTTTVSYHALPKIKCPACQQDAVDEQHPHLIPLDIGYVFFTLAAFKISQVEGAAE